MRGLKQTTIPTLPTIRKSHLLQMRGLKPVRHDRMWKEQPVASFTDAWIETVAYMTVCHKATSRIFYRCVDWNLGEWKRILGDQVASFTDAWIETISTGYGTRIVSGRIFYRCVDWNPKCTYRQNERSESHLLQMRGLKQVPRRYFHAIQQSHLLQMRGLKRFPHGLQ